MMELFEFGIEYATEYDYRKLKEVREVINLLQHLQNSKLRELKERLLKYKELHKEKILD
jgi:hypothetical protein